MSAIVLYKGRDVSSYNQSFTATSADALALEVAWLNALCHVTTHRAAYFVADASANRRR